MAFGKKKKAASLLDRYASQGAPLDRYSRNSDAYTKKKEEILASYSRHNGEQYSHKRAKKGGIGKKVAAVVCSLLLVGVLGAGAAAFIYMNGISNDLAGDKTEQEQFDIQEALVTASFDEPFYMLLIGSDSRDENDFEGSRSDTNILTRVDPINKTVTMISVPRDTKITYKGSTVKFNAAYAYDGVAGAINATSDLCDVQIAHYVQIGFEGIKTLVDSMGGVEVDVPYSIDDDDAWGAIDAGYQTLSGWDALVFARSRQYADGDFTRTSNQRLLVEAIANKALQLSPTDLLSTAQAAAKCIDTDMSLFEIYSLAMTFKDDLTIYSAMVPSTTAYIDDVSYVLCDTATLKKMMQIVEEGGDPNTVENSSGSAIGSAL